MDWSKPEGETIRIFAREVCDPARRRETLPHLPGEILVWEEEESSAALIARLVDQDGRLALDDGLPLFFYHALAAEMGA
ncbi:hypothetical protein AB9F39_37880, partial [Rhizobium leguminosarum]